MLGQSVLQQTSMESIIREHSIINPSSERRVRSVNAELLLTALIDAFSILVIFLLMSFSSTGDILFISKGMELPKAALGEILERAPVVKIDDNKIYLEEEELAANNLTAGLLKLREEYQAQHPGENYPGVVTIQADRRVKYEVLNSIVVAASQAGFSDMRFAVLMR